MDELTMLRKSAYETACLADNMWDAELQRVYGTGACDARYDRKRNAATPMLKALYDVKTNADKAWHTLGKIQRNEIAA